MNVEKQTRKLEKLYLRAETCLSRKEANKILKKHAKIRKKLKHHD
jgi:hypothetical protein